MTGTEIVCDIHGVQGMGLVCGHIAVAVDAGERVGFYWSDDVDQARPDAWCSKCQEDLVAQRGGPWDDWFVEGDFKFFCAGCWDHAKRVCGGFVD